MQYKEFIYNDRKFKLSEYGDLIRLAYEDIRPHQYGDTIKYLHRYNKERIIKPTLNKWGYYEVSLTSNNKSTNFSIHQLVYLVFIENKIVVDKKYDYNFNTKNFNQINHKDGNKLNNHYTNLELISLQENIKHAVNNKLHNSQTKAKYVDIYYNDKYIKTIWKLRSVEKFLKDNFSVYIPSSQICRLIRSQKSSKGFRFEYNECNDYPEGEYKLSDLEVKINQEKLG